MTLEVANQTVNLPTDIIQFAFKTKNQNALKVFVAAKLASSGSFASKSSVFNSICILSGLQRRSVLHHLETLISLGWVGFDATKKHYYLRSWAFLKKKEFISSRAAFKLTITDMSHFKEFIFSAAVSLRISKQKIYNQSLLKDNHPKRHLKSEKSRSAINIRGIASQEHSSFRHEKALPYYGLSNQSIAEMLNLSLSRACEIKQLAIKANYIKTRKHFQLLAEYDSPQPNLRKSLFKAYGEQSSKIRINTQIRDGIKYLQLVIQLHDEITPAIRPIRINYNKLWKTKFIKSVSPLFLPISASSA